jgi:hypothetical protein
VEQRVVIKPEQFLDGSPMQQSDGAVRDLKLIYPETGFDAMSLCLGLVEIDPGHHSPLHRHRCEEVYYVVKGSGELESDGVRREISPGCAVFNRPGHEVVDHHTYFICSDGDLMEGVSHEAASFAGHNKLGKLVGFYDDNRITIEGDTRLTSSERTADRFLAQGWHVDEVELRADGEVDTGGMQVDGDGADRVAEVPDDERTDLARRRRQGGHVEQCRRAVVHLRQHDDGHRVVERRHQVVDAQRSRTRLGYPPHPEVPLPGQ